MMQVDEVKLSDVRMREYLETYLQLKSRYYLVMYSLLVAGIAQGTLYSSLLKAVMGQDLLPVALLLSGLPWSVYFVVTLARVPPPIMPVSLGRLLLFVMALYMTNTLVLVVCWLARLVPSGLPLVASRVLWIAALAGLLGTPTLHHFQGAFRRQAIT